MGAAITTATLVIGLSASCGAFSSTAQPRPPTALRAKKADPSRVADGLVLAYRGALLAGDGAAAGTVRAGLEGSGLAVDGPFDGRGEAAALSALALVAAQAPSRAAAGSRAALLALAVAAASAYAGDADAALAAVVLACCYREVAFFGLEYKVEAAAAGAAAASRPPLQAVDAGAAAAYALLAVAKVLEPLDADRRPDGSGFLLGPAASRDRAERTVGVREAVLWPGRRDMCVLASDGDGTHFGAFFPAADNERPVGAIAFYEARGYAADGAPFKKYPGSDEVYVRMRKPLGSVVD
ncbi:Acetyltransferase [Aureococcus anophagefferens]|nr:Acetyltransferase [Aureococcus anophagefferens]